MKMTFSPATGTVWYGAGSGAVCDSGETIDQRLASMADPRPAGRQVVVAGTLANARLIVGLDALFHEVRVVRPVQLSPGRAGVDPPPAAELALGNQSPRPLLGPVDREAWRVLTGDLPVEQHPAWPVLGFAGLKPADALGLFARVRDPRWYQFSRPVLFDADGNPDQSNGLAESPARLWTHLGLRRQTADDPLAVTLTAAVAGLDPANPFARHLRETEASGPDGPLQAARCLARACWRYWLGQLVHVELFDAEAVFRTDAELAAWRAYLKSSKLGMDCAERAE